MKFLKNKKAENLLTENAIFIIIAVAFIAMLFTFVANKSFSGNALEESYAKKLALMIDSARPGTYAEINIDNLLEKKTASMSDADVFSISGNTVTVKLSSGSGYSYNFFNDVNVKWTIKPESGSKFLTLEIEDANK